MDAVTGFVAGILVCTALMFVRVNISKRKPAPSADDLAMGFRLRCGQRVGIADQILREAVAHGEIPADAYVVAKDDRRLRQVLLYRAADAYEKRNP